MIFINNYDTFKQNYEFKTVYGRGKSFLFPALVVYIKNNKQNKIRIGITASKKIGCAVKRNRAKRVITAAFREILPQINIGLDIVFVARARTTSCKMQEVKAYMQKAFSKYFENLNKE